MKRLWMLLPALLAIGLAGCGGGGGGDTPATVALTGTVVDTNGAGLANVAVRAAGATVQTNAAGQFTGLNVPANSVVAVEFTHDNFTTANRVVATGTTAATVTAVMAPLGVRQPAFDAAAGGTVTHARGDSRPGSVTFQPGSIRTAAGAAVATADVRVTCSLPGDPRYPDVFPGLFLGITAPGAAAVGLESFGILTVEMRDAAGAALQLDPTKPATIRIPVSATADTGEATIPLWSLNKATGVWTQEGVATRQMIDGVPTYVAEVTHFSTYNLDKPITSNQNIRVLVLNETGRAQPGAAVTVTLNQSGGGVWQGRGTTNSNGLVELQGTPGGSLSAEATFGSSTGMASSFSDDGPNWIKTTVVVFGNTPAPAKGTITLNITDHLNRPVADGYVFGHSIDPKDPQGHIHAEIKNGKAVLTDCTARAYEIMIEGGASFYSQVVFRTQQNVTVNIKLPQPSTTPGP